MYIIDQFEYNTTIRVVPCRGNVPFRGNVPYGGDVLLFIIGTPYDYYNSPFLNKVLHERTLGDQLRSSGLNDDIGHNGKNVIHTSI